MAITLNPTVENTKKKIASASTEVLFSLKFFVETFPSVGHQTLPYRTMNQSAIDADLLRFLIQCELDDRRKKDGAPINSYELPYSWGEMYSAVKIPKEFLDK